MMSPHGFCPKGRIDNRTDGSQVVHVFAVTVSGNLNDLVDPTKPLATIGPSRTGAFPNPASGGSGPPVGGPTVGAPTVIAQPCASYGSQLTANGTPYNDLSLANCYFDVHKRASNIVI